MPSWTSAPRTGRASPGTTDQPAGRAASTTAARSSTQSSRTARCPGRTTRSYYPENTPFRTWPSWPKKLVVPAGCDLKLNPRALVADHLIVTGLWNNRPEEPGGLVTGELCPAGPSQRMSKDTVAATDAGFWKRNRALGILKKSLE